MSSRKVEQRYLHLCIFEKQVFSCVPISDKWTTHQIMQELYRQYQKKPALNALQRSLSDMVDAGLIKRDSGESYHREGISLDQKPKPVNGGKDMKLITNPVEPAKETKKPSPLAEIYAIADSLESLNERMAKAILALDEYLETQKADNDKARKIAELLKEINK